MIKADLQCSLLFLLTVKYEYAKNEQYDYSAASRPCHNLVFMLCGSAEIVSENEKITLHAGELLYIPQGSYYSAKWIAEPKAVFHSLHFAFNAEHNPLQNRLAPVQKIDCNDFYELYSLVKKIAERRFLNGADGFFALSAFFELFGKISERIAVNEKQNHTALSKAIKYIENNYKSKISVDKLAELCFLSTSRFYHLFKEKLGVSPIVYKNDVAIKHAAQELLYQPEKSIAAIAKDNGFSSVVYFERAFKKNIGKTPSEYRKYKRLI